MSVTIEIPIPEELIPNLEKRAQNAGLNREQYLSELLSRELSSTASLDDVLSRFRTEVKASGITDGELSDLFLAARDESSRPKL